MTHPTAQPDLCFLMNQRPHVINSARKWPIWRRDIRYEYVLAHLPTRVEQFNGGARSFHAKLAGHAAQASVLQGCAGYRKGRPVSMLRISPSCRTNTMPTVAITFRGRSDM